MGESVQRFRLLHRPGEPVQDIALLAVIRLQAVLHDADDHFIWHQFARFDIPLGRKPHFGARFHRLTEHIAGGNLGNAQFVHQKLRMGAFACAGRS